MEYSYKKDNLNSDLVAFIENVIFPEYEKNEKAHGIEHIITVLDHANNISKNYDVNPNMIYTIVAFHDIGHHIDKDNHEKISADMMKEYKELNNFFSKEEIKIMIQAVEDHRASSSHEPRNLYGKIISAADKNHTVETAIQRTYLYGIKYFPEYSKNQIYERIYNHLDEKFGKNGYAKVYIKDENFESFKNELIELLENKELFFEKITEVIKNMNE